MAKPDLTDYKKFRFNKSVVEQLYEDYTAKNPDADQATLNEVLQELVATEVIIATRLTVMKNEDPNVDIKAKDKELRTKISKKDDKVHKFFVEYMGDKRMSMLLNFQTSNAKANNYKNFARKASEDYANIYYAEVERPQKRETAYNVPNIIDEAFFNPTVKEDVYKVQYENDTVKENCEKWQKEACEITIDVPEGLDADLISFAVLGNMISDEHLQQVHRELNKGGSTLLVSLNEKETVKMSFFENITKFDRRGNMQAIRSVVPDSRKNIKEIIDNKDNKALFENIKRAAADLYQFAMTTSASSTSFEYSVTKLNQLFELADKNNIDLKDIGMDSVKRNRIDIQLQRLKLEQYRQGLQAELDKSITDFVLSGGKNPDADMFKNPKLNGILLDIMGIEGLQQAMADEFEAEVNVTRSAFLNDPQVQAAREFGEVEKQFSKKPYATFQYFRSLAEKSDLYKKFKAGNYEDKQAVMSGGNRKRFNYYGDALQYGNWEIYERDLAKGALELSLEAANEYLVEADKKMASGNVTEKDKQIYDAAVKIKTKIEEVIEFRTAERMHGADFSDIEHGRLMAEKYNEIDQAKEAYHNLNPSWQFISFDADQKFESSFRSYDKMLLQFEHRQELLDKQGELLNFTSQYRSAQTLYSVKASHVYELKWGVTKGGHVAHFFDKPTDKMLEIDVHEEVEPQIGVTQKDAYNTLSDKATRNAFKQLVEISATEYEKPGIDKQYKNILRAVKTYVTAEGRADQAKAAENLSGLIKDYQKKIKKAGKISMELRTNLDALDKISQTLQTLNNGTLTIKPEDNVIYSGKEPADAGLGHLGIWRKTNAPLFSHEPSPNDIKQGMVNDCFMMSALAKIAKDHPEKIKENIVDNNDGTVTVRFFDSKRNKETNEMEKVPVYIKVNKTVNKSLTGAHIYSSSATWVQMYEKAYAEFVSRPGYSNYLGNPKDKGFQRLNRGFSSQFLDAFDDKTFYANTKENFGIYGYEKALYGLNAPKRNEYTQTEKELFDFFSRTNDGEVMTVGGTTDDKRRQSYMKDHGVRPDHAYAVMGTFTKEVNGVEKHFIQLRDPYATFEAKYNDKNELADNSALIGNSLKAGSDTMGTFNLELTDFLKMYNSIPGMTKEANNEFIKLQNRWYDRNVEFEKVKAQMAKEEPNKGGFMDDVEVVETEVKEKNDFVML